MDNPTNTPKASRREGRRPEQRRPIGEYIAVPQPEAAGSIALVAERPMLMLTAAAFLDLARQFLEGEIDPKRLRLDFYMRAPQEEAIEARVILVDRKDGSGLVRSDWDEDFGKVILDMCTRVASSAVSKASEKDEQEEEDRAWDSHESYDNDK